MFNVRTKHLIDDLVQYLRQPQATRWLHHAEQRYLPFTK